jgi:hypothetical protein
MTGMAVVLFVRPIVRHRGRFAQCDERGDGCQLCGDYSRTPKMLESSPAAKLVPDDQIELRGGAACNRG